MLVRRIAAADADALHELYDRWCSRVYAIAVRIVPEEEAVEEVTESTFWHVWRRAGEYDATHGSVEHWLEETARSRAKECLRLRPSPRGEIEALQRRAVELACFGRMSLPEIAECLGEPPGTIQSWIRLSLERLRRPAGPP